MKSNPIIASGEMIADRLCANLGRLDRADWKEYILEAINELAVDVQAEPDFYGFRNDDECRVDMCFSPSAPRGDGVYATAYYTAPQTQPAEKDSK